MWVEVRFSGQLIYDLHIGLCQVYQFDDSATQEFIPNNMPYFRYELDFECTMTESKLALTVSASVT